MDTPLYIMQIVKLTNTDVWCKYKPSADSPRISEGYVTKKSFGTKYQKNVSEFKIGDFFQGAWPTSAEVLEFKKITKPIYRPFKKIEIKTTTLSYNG